MSTLNMKVQFVGGGVKGTRLRVADIVAMFNADPELTPEEVARDLKVPNEAIAECHAYAVETALSSKRRGRHARSRRRARG